MSKSTLPLRPEQAEPTSRHPEPILDPFGMPANPADYLDWPPSDLGEMAKLDEWVSAMEREAAERNGNSPGDE